MDTESGGTWRRELVDRLPTQRVGKSGPAWYVLRLNRVASSPRLVVVALALAVWAGVSSAPYLFWFPLIALVWLRWSRRRPDRVAAASLAAELRAGKRPEPLESSALVSFGVLEAGEVCFVDGALIYAREHNPDLPPGRNSLVQLMRLSHKLTQQRGEWWVTNRRFIVHSLAKGDKQIWIQIPFSEIVKSWPAKGGVVLSTAKLEIRVTSPFVLWTFVLYEWLAHDRIPHVRAPLRLRLKPSAPRLAYPA